jgi:hypothetical protein
VEFSKQRKQINCSSGVFTRLVNMPGVELLLEVGTAACSFSLKPRAAGLFSKPTAMPVE